MRGRPTHPPGTDRRSRHDWWGVVLDSRDPAASARFYAALLGWSIESEDEDGAAVLASDGVAYLAFQHEPLYRPPTWPATPEDQRMMMHLDFEVESLTEAVADALDLGASEADHQPQEDVRVMLDPEGRPFCLYLSPLRD